MRRQTLVQVWLAIVVTAALALLATALASTDLAAQWFQYPTAGVPRKAGGKGSVEFLRIDLTDVLVSSYAISSAGGGSFPQDTFNLSFSKIKFTYTPQNEDGSAGTPVSFCTDVRTDRPC